MAGRPLSRPGSNRQRPYETRTWTTKIRRWRKARQRMQRLSRRRNR